MTFTAAEKAAEAKREVGQRKFVYVSIVARGKITQAAADKKIAIMEAIQADYEAQAQKDRLL
jgi:hypothetical protein